MTDFRKTISEILSTPDSRGRAELHLERYYRECESPGDGYTGRYFEPLIASSDPNHFTAYDVAAMAALSVPMMGRAVGALLIERLAPLNAFLTAPGFPDERTALWELTTDQISDDESPLARLYFALRDLPDVGPVTASKLMAAKRPHLIPIRDRIVADLLGATDSHPWWLPMHEAVTDPELREAVDAVSGGVRDRVSLLRRLDVILWMEGNHRNPRPRTKAPASEPDSELLGDRDRSVSSTHVER